ncbi:transporter substrate-binding domain-containing protein [Aeromonas schubertii]|uniref:Transporter substrate-binding domain-containing protein n=1 Tax=Aeromonas schubertii TaxID=652 RepID=A0ABS7V6D8_9GAMM|nr:transporter substrate-binding domain-containing protein [Aeromonas schubertii]MBZ6064947.1 transporter substrate-binding domain-containing protein [Aeromonas schubertii]
MPLLLCALIALLVSGSALAIEVLAAEVPPYAIKSQQGAPTGMAVEVLEEAARRLGEPLHIEVLPFARALSQARHRKDVLLLPPAWSEERASHFLWIVPLLEESFVLVTDRRHHPTPLTLVEARRRGDKIGVLRNSLAHDRLRRVEGVTLELATEEVRNAQKLSLGRISAWAAAWNTVNYNQLRAELPTTHLLRGETLQRTSLYLAAHPEFPAAQASRWRAALESMHRDGTLRRILAQYDYQAPEP